MAMFRVLVTGAAGFLGRHVCRRLLREGSNVVALGRTAASLDAVTGNTHLKVACDLEWGDVASALAGVGPLDAIVHCAALSSNWGSRAAFYSANVAATRNLLTQARCCGSPHIVFVSSSSVYFDFRDRLLVKEDEDLPDPVNNYAWSKRAAEASVREQREMPTTIIRPRGIYGRGDTALLPRLLRAAQRGPLPMFRGGGTVIDLTHVGDVAKAVIAVLRSKERTHGKVYNVSGGEPLAVRAIIERSAARAGIDVKWRRTSWPLARLTIGGLERYHEIFCPAVEPFATVYSAGLLAFSQSLDITSIASDTGWHPRITFAEGLDRTFGST